MKLVKFGSYSQFPENSEMECVAAEVSTNRGFNRVAIDSKFKWGPSMTEPLRLYIVMCSEPKEKSELNSLGQRRLGLAVTLYMLPRNAKSYNGLFITNGVPTIIWGSLARDEHVYPCSRIWSYITFHYNVT